MKILTINYEYPPVGGGGGVFAANLSEALASRGHHIDYITTRYPGSLPFEQVSGVHLHRERVLARKDLHTASIISMLSYPPVAIRRALALARRHKYDIIHSHFAIPSGPAGYALSRWLRLPHILSIYGGDIYDPSKRYSPHRHPVLYRAVKKVLNQADAIIGESRDICDRAVQHFAARTTPRLIPLGFKPPAFTPQSRTDLGLRTDITYAIAVSRLIPRKDYATLLRAFARAQRPNLHLIIIGDGPELPAMQQLATQLHITDRIIFRGATDDPTKFALLSAADFFVLSPLHEGYGIVYQEAMYSGLPIATTNNGGHTDFLTENRNALLTPVSDPEALARSLQTLTDAPHLRTTMRQNNLNDIQNQMITTVAETYESLMSELISK